MESSFRWVKALLKRWLHYERDFEFIDEREKERMKILFSALKKMEPDEVQILADKYRRTGKPLSDPALAVQMGITEPACNKMRRGLEHKLWGFMQAQVEELEVEREREFFESRGLKPPKAPDFISG